MFPQHIRYNILKHVIWVRWAVAFSFIPLLLLASYLETIAINTTEAQSRLKIEFVSFLALSLFVISYNLIFIFLEKRRKKNLPLNNFFLRILFFLTYYLILDSVAITWGMYNTGGPPSVIGIIFFLVLLFLAVSHSYRAVIYVGIFDLILVNSVFFLNQSGILYSLDLFYLEEYFRYSKIFTNFSIITYDLIFSISIFLSAIISKTLFEKENLLTDERDKFQLLIENLKDGLVILNPKNHIISLNKAASKILGIEKEIVIGKRVDISMFEDPKFKNLARMILIKEEKAEKEFIPIEIQIQKPSPAVLHVYSVNVYDKEKLVATMKILRDISREKEISRMKSEFISIAAHQLRTPLSAVKWTFKMLSSGDFGKITSEQEEFLKRGYDVNEQMIKLVNDLLNVSRIEEGKFGYKFGNASLEKIIDNLIEMIENIIKEKEIKLSFQRPQKSLPLIRVDEERLSLAIQNIIDNAVNYTPNKGEVIITLKQSETNAILEIKDTGIGIPKPQINRLFTKFFRADNVLRMQTKGTGLGLFIAKNIIEKHGGEIEIESEEGKGTIVSIRLPLEGKTALKKEEEFVKFIKNF